MFQTYEPLQRRVPDSSGRPWCKTDFFYLRMTAGMVRNLLSTLSPSTGPSKSNDMDLRPQMSVGEPA
jgi:hypothetical protein